MVSLLGWWIWDYVTVFFDNIPKLMYWLYTALASALDALQCLMRRLAGLDVYYVGGSTWGSPGTPVRETDPVLQFIMGILGIGDNATAYTGLTTVFWSLAIFGVIVLVLSTMVAIIKSHYQEDSSKTNPVTHIYAAIKAVFTFAIVPIAVIVGFWLSGFLLRTLDSIISGSASDASLEGYYGSNYDQVFKPAYLSGTEGYEAGDTVYYSRYDFFGEGGATNTTTFSGLLFRTCANNANRLRRGDYTVDGTDADFYDFNIFGKYYSDEFQRETADLTGQNLADAKAEWVAYQIDYAFMNNLQLQNKVGYSTIYDKAPILISIAGADFFTIIGNVDSFSKFNVGLVWYYYNLWSFDFMIGFISIITCFTLFVNIIIGLMQRLIKSAALFLIYPAVLGLNPIDGGQAFGKWRTEFMQQALMAFGSIIGLNLFFLIFPYLDNIRFFGIDILDYLTNIIMIVAGLQMIKTFIGFLSGLIGGADAQAAGASASGEMKSMLATGASMTLGTASLAWKGTKLLSPGAPLAARTAKIVLGSTISGVDSRRAKKNALSAEDYKKASENLTNAKKQQKEDKKTAFNTDTTGLSTRFKNEARNKGLKGFAADKYAREQFHDYMMSHDKEYRKKYMDQQGTIDRNGLDKKQYKREQKSDHLTARAQTIRQATYRDPITGGGTLRGAASFFLNPLREAGGSFAKYFGETLKKAVPVGGLREILTSGLSAVGRNKYDDKGEKIGEYMGAKAPPATKEEAREIRQQLRAGFADIGGRAFSAAFGMYPSKPFAKKESESDKLSRSADTMASSSKNLSDATVGLDKVSKQLSELGKGLVKATQAIQDAATGLKGPTSKNPEK